MCSSGSQPLFPLHSRCPEGGSASAARGRERGCGPGQERSLGDQCPFHSPDRHPASPRSCSPSAPPLPVLLSVRLSVRQAGRAAASLRAVKVGVDARQPRRSCQALSLLAFPSLRPSLRGALLSRSPALPLFTPSGSAAALCRGAPDGTGQRDRAGRARTVPEGRKDRGWGAETTSAMSCPGLKGSAATRGWLSCGDRRARPGSAGHCGFPRGPRCHIPVSPSENDHGPGREGLSSQVAVPGAG